MLGGFYGKGYVELGGWVCEDGEIRCGRSLVRGVECN